MQSSRPLERGCQCNIEPAADNLGIVPDRGYYSGEEILAGELSGITVTLPKPITLTAQGEGRFGKQDSVAGLKVSVALPAHTRSDVSNGSKWHAIEFW